MAKFSLTHTLNRNVYVSSTSNNISKWVVTFSVVTFRFNEVVTFFFEKLLQFASNKLLHFASKVITFLVNATCCSVISVTSFLLWLVLHHNLFSFQEFPKKYETFTCGFQAYVQNSNTMLEEPKHLVFKTSFEVNDTIIERQYTLL